MNRIRILAQTVKEPMFLLLVTACILYFFLGQVQEGLLMAAAIVFVSTISYYQEIRSDNALQALNRFIAPQVKIIRAGKQLVVPAAELLIGDVFLIEEGDLVPADGLLIEANDMSINESTLTGESMPVEKHPNDDRALFQGTLVNTGRGYGRVTATGKKTRLGQLGNSLAAIHRSQTPLQQQTGKFVKTMTGMGFGIFLLVSAVNFWHSHAWVASLLAGLTLAMAIIPEEIPVALSSFMAIGAFRMAKLGMIVRQPSSVESLGSVTVICLDKTGTLTENRMSLAAMYDPVTGVLEKGNAGEILNHPRILYFARLASEREPFDMMEKAIVEAYDRQPSDGHELPEMIHEYPLGGQPPMMTHVYRSAGHIVVAGKGAPERLITVCGLTGKEKEKIMDAVIDMARMGYRVLGVGSADHPGGDYPPAQDGFNWRFEGLIGLIDPPKKGVDRQVAGWRRAGIGVKLLTGDYPDTARAVATLAGIPADGRMITGTEVMNASPEELRSIAVENTLFSRMFPEAKQRLIEALKQQGEFVAMLGDGVNDGPALKTANIGIAMGAKGTEIARRAADLVLTEDDLGQVSEAIRQGRRIYQNIKKAIHYILSIHIPIMAIAAVPVLLNWRYPNIFTPIHVIFLELIMGPTCSLFYEREPAEPQLMTTRGRSKHSVLFSRRELLAFLSQGLVLSVAILSIYYYYMQQGASQARVRTFVFVTLIIANIFLTFVNRSFYEPVWVTIHYPNSLLPYTIGTSAVFLALLLRATPVQRLFGIERLTASGAACCLVVAAAGTLWPEIIKSRRKRRDPH